MKSRAFSILGAAFLAGCFLGAGLSWASSAKDFPEKPVNAIIPFAPGGAPDLLFRPLSDLAKKHLGTPIVVLNKPGAGGVTGTVEVAKAKPDGYTILMNFGGGEHLIYPYLEKVPYDTFADFEPVILLSYYPSGLFVREEAPWKSLEDFILAAKNKPGELRYSNPGTPTMVNIAAVAFQKMAGITLSPIPTGGGNPALNMLLGGHVEAAQLGVPVAWPQVQAKKIRCLADSLPKSSEMYPGAPTYLEKGFDIRFAINQGIAAPKGTPREVIKKIHDAYAAAYRDKSTQEVMTTLRFAPYYLNSEDFAKYLREMYQYYGEVIKKVGITIKK